MRAENLTGGEKGIHLEDIIESLRTYSADADVRDILGAYAFASKVHGGQARLSGEPYMSHPMEVALILTQLKMEPSVLATALLHDTVEDTDATVEDVKKLFGEEIARMVEGLTKLAKIRFRTREQRQAENVRKMILALSEDIRIVIIKLADRMHNMRTLEYLPSHRQKAIAIETLDIYAPIAGRLGISWMKGELEERAFMYVHPVEQTKLKRKLAERKEELEKIIRAICNQTKEILMKEHIACDVTGRVKNPYSIFKKMKKQGLDYGEVHDIIGVRVITASRSDCYRALGQIHERWKPVPGKLKDYIAIPKENMYQSIHTTIVTGNGRRVEFQIRTQQMHMMAENGIAAHWRYKDGGGLKAPNDDGFIWIRRLIDMGRSLDDSEEFLENVKLDLFPDEVYVFTPKQEVKAFPKGATPLDFAYAVHTEIGHHSVSAIVNSNPVELDYVLENGDTVEIITSDTQEPEREWLKIVKTSHARASILSYIRSMEREDAIRLAEQIIKTELKNFGLKPEKYFTPEALANAATGLGFKNTELLLQKIGFSKMPVYGFLQKLLPAAEWEKIQTKRQSSLKGLVQKFLWRKSFETPAVQVGDLKNRLIRFAQCCNPVPGDRIQGYVTSGQGMVIHTKSCPLLKKLEPDPEKLIEAQWDVEAKKQLHPVRIVAYSANQPGMLAHISAAIASCHANISTAVVSPTDPKWGELDITLEIEDLPHLNRVLEAVKKVDGVKSVKRIMQNDLGWTNEIGESKIKEKIDRDNG
jgi:GTP pyrophosphokinase